MVQRTLASLVDEAARGISSETPLPSLDDGTVILGW